MENIEVLSLAELTTINGGCQIGDCSEFIFPFLKRTKFEILL